MMMDFLFRIVIGSFFRLILCRPSIDLGTKSARSGGTKASVAIPRPVGRLRHPVISLYDTVFVILRFSHGICGLWA